MSRKPPRVLLVGTADTKAAELSFLADAIAALGADSRTMDVGVLGTPGTAVHASAAEVATAAGHTLSEVRASGDENEAMTRMARGASRLAAGMHARGEIDGVLVIGGTMGTDLALDVAGALPMGVPKLLLSTIAHSHLIPPERVAPDLIAMLWAGGLYGINAVCEATLRTAAGAIVGACRARAPIRRDRPLIGMTSFGASALTYMIRLKPALDERGFELAVFHATGMGGRAFESLSRGGAFAAVMDFCLQEVCNHVHGSVVSSGASRLTGAGEAGVPQLVAPGAIDMIDFAGHLPLPEPVRSRPARAHNRLLQSVAATAEERRASAAHIACCLARAKGPLHLMLPLRGVEQWDRPGEALHDPQALAAFFEELDRRLPPTVDVTRIDTHINDDAFTDAVLARFDRWVDDGTIRRDGSHGAWGSRT